MIDDTGDDWIGTEPADVEQYLVEYTASGYKATVFRLLHCDCNDQRFSLERAGSTTRRTCISCGNVRYISRGGGGTEEDWALAVYESDGSESYACVGCGSTAANVGVGFAGYTQHPSYKNRPAEPLPDAVLWFFVGTRCVRCGILGCFNDSKVAWGPAAEVYVRVPG